MILNKVKKIIRQIIGLFPSKLPTGIESFDSFVYSLINTYSMPTINEDSIKFTVSTAIMHLGPTAAYKSKFYFYLLINAAAAKQVAGSKFSDIKQAQLASRNKPAEVPAHLAGTSYVKPIQN